MLNSNKNVVEKTETWTFFIVSYTLQWHSQLHTDDIVNKSVVFRIIETSCHIIDV